MKKTYLRILSIFFLAQLSLAQFTQIDISDQINEPMNVEEPESESVEEERVVTFERDPHEVSFLGWQGEEP